MPSVDRRTVAITGGTARSGPITLGQADMLAWACDGSEPTNMYLVWNIPVGTTLARIEEILARLFLRHESLRTIYRLGPDPVQIVTASAEVPVEVVENVHGAPMFADELAASLANAPFDLQRDWQMRFAVVTLDGTPVQLTVATSHVAIDMASFTLLKNEWDALAADRSIPEPAPVQPIDLAAMERTPQGRRRTASAAHHWEAQLRRAPQSMFALPGVEGGVGARPTLLVRSRPAAKAITKVANRTRAGRSSIVQAAMCALVGHYVALSTCLVTAVSANRFLPELAGFIGPLSRDALLAVDCDVPTFDELVRRVRHQAMFAYAKGCDDTTLATTIGRLGRERGTWYARDCEFNDYTGFSLKLPFGHAVPDPGDELQVSWLAGRELISRLTLWTVRLEDIVEICLWADPQALPTAQAECFGTGIVRLIEAAGDRDVPLDELGELTGLKAADRGAGWYRVDSSWVDVAGVRRLVADALGGRPSHVTIVPDSRLGHRIECYVSGGGDSPSLHLLHDACVNALPNHPTAIAPHLYVACSGTPTNRQDTEAWRVLPRLAAGDGRQEGR